jgi:hypothetical protein
MELKHFEVRALRRNFFDEVQNQILGADRILGPDGDVNHDRRRHFDIQRYAQRPNESATR